MFSSFRFYFRSFTVSGLIFKFLYAFELIFVGGVRYGSSFILLSVAIQFFQYHSLKILSFPQWVFLTPLSEIDHVCVGLYPGSHSVPLVSLCACFIVHPPQFSWSELLVQMLQSFYFRWDHSVVQGGGVTHRQFLFRWDHSVVHCGGVTHRQFLF